MVRKPGFGFVLWTWVISILAAIALFWSIVDRHGAWKSILMSALAIGAIWLTHFGISRLIQYDVTREMKKRSRKEAGEGKGGKK